MLNLYKAEEITCNETLILNKKVSNTYNRISIRRGTSGEECRQTRHFARLSLTVIEAQLGEERRYRRPSEVPLPLSPKLY